MSQKPPAVIGQRAEEVDTPALVLDLDAFERNLDTLARAVAGKVRVRAHAKTHKSPDIARRQIAAGAVGVCCQKVSEAEALVEGGVQDVLVSNEIVGPAKIARLAELSRRARLGVCVDNLDNLRQIAASGARLDVYIELEVGMGRCGIAPGEPALALAREIAKAPGLRFGGLQAYHGRAQHVRSMSERRAHIARAAEAVNATRALFSRHGIETPIVTGAGSGSFMFEVESGAWDEIQPGSYIFMDGDYARNEWAAPLPRFDHALFVLATVMSRPSPHAAVVDAGLKASSVDSGMPTVWGKEVLKFTKASDEHGFIEGPDPPALGEKLFLVPGHCDPTVNLYDWYVCVRKNVVEDLWPITARGALT
ncbi:MAG TPA: DSD1 family PLP-dependent enzyme [Burkholderiales bacterium]|jgi:D-serine deaminase-like pyridoxal phosphate-dependent protein|nr:DSD1 family PLP-dependent enzyme [Burkholderiales bacterium]